MQGSGKLLPLALSTGNNWNCSVLLSKSLVNIEHLQSFLLSLFCGGMSRVPFLPEKFRRAQEQSRAHFPP